MVINNKRKYSWKCAILLTNPYFHTAWKVSKYGAFSGPHFPAFSPNTGKYGQGKTPYLDTFHAVSLNTNAATRGGCEKCIFKNLQSIDLQLYEKRDSGTGIFPRILRNF